MMNLLPFSVVGSGSMMSKATLSYGLSDVLVRVSGDLVNLNSMLDLHFLHFLM